MELYTLNWASQVALVVKNPPANAGDLTAMDLIPGSGRFPCRRAWQPTPVFLPGESQGQRSLAGYSKSGRRVKYNWKDLARMHTLSWCRCGLWLFFFFLMNKIESSLLKELTCLWDSKQAGNIQLKLNGQPLPHSYLFFLYSSKGNRSLPLPFTTLILFKIIFLWKIRSLR